MTSITHARIRPPAAVLFDMDGTLTRPRLDFARIRGELAVPARIGILEHLDALRAVDPDAADRLDDLLFRHEREAALAAEPNEGAEALLAALAARGIRCAVVTRNAASHAAITLRRLGFDMPVLVARDHARPKPAPDPVLLACARLEVAPSAAWFVGDGRDDILAGRAAGCPVTVLLTNGVEPMFTHRATHVIVRLAQLHDLLPAATPGAR